jgi:hypothetical protein
MNRFVLFTALTLTAAMYAGCNKNEEPEVKVPGIEGITLENFPRMDGSTSCRHLNTIIACRLLDIPYTWQEPGVLTEWSVQPRYEDNIEMYLNFFSERVPTSQTRSTCGHPFRPGPQFDGIQTVRMAANGRCKTGLCRMRICHEMKSVLLAGTEVIS